MALAPESKVLPGQVSSRLFGGLKAGEVRCVTCICTCMQQVSATVAAVVYPEAPVSPHSSVPATQVFPKAACQGFIWPEPWESRVVPERGVCVGTGVTLVALARDRTGSRPCAQSAVDALGGMRSYVLVVGQRSLPAVHASPD